MSEENLISCAIRESDMKIFDMQLTLIIETRCFKYYKAFGYGKTGYDYRENKDGAIETKKGEKWISIDGKIES